MYLCIPYSPDFTLNIPASNMENQNTPKYLSKQQNTILQLLSELPHVPSVQYSTVIPRDPELLTELQDQAIESNTIQQLDQRQTQKDTDESKQRDNEYFDDENTSNDNAYLTKGTHRDPIDPATAFYQQQQKLNSNNNSLNNMDTS